MADFDFKAALNRKLGPLKAWQWGAIGGGAFLLWRYLGARRSNQLATATDPYAQGSALYSTMSGGGAMAPASLPPEFTPGFGNAAENFYLSLPYGEGYLSLEGSGELVQGILGDLLALGLPTPSAPTYPAPLGPQYGSFYPQYQPIQAPSVQDNFYAVTYQPPTEVGYYEAPSPESWPTTPAYEPVPVYVGEYQQTSPSTYGGSGLPTCPSGWYAAVGAFNPSTNSYDMICKPNGT